MWGSYQFLILHCPNQWGSNLSSHWDHLGAYKNIYVYPMAIKSQSVPGQWHLTKAPKRVAWAENHYSKGLRAKKNCSFSEPDPSNNEHRKTRNNTEKKHRWRVILGLESTFLNGRHLYLGSLRMQWHAKGLSSWEWTGWNLHG